MQVVNADYPTSPQIAAFFGSPDEGAFVMVNPLKFKPKAIYADGADAHLTGMKAYARYGEAVVKHRAAGLEGQLNILTKPMAART